MDQPASLTPIAAAMCVGHDEVGRKRGEWVLRTVLYTLKKKEKEKTQPLLTVIQLNAIKLCLF